MLAPSVPNPKEVATLIVDGQEFEDWESVFIEIYHKGPASIFRFTCAEREPVPELWQKVQFVPGSECQIKLGGALVITGVILIRQVAYDANNHGVMLQGIGETWFAARASILHEDSNFKGGYKEVAKQVLAPTGIGAVFIGEIDGTPFKPPVHNEPGETIWDFLERIARDRKVVIGSDTYGNFLFFGEHQNPNVGGLIEGVNILKCNAIINAQDIYSEYIARAQKTRSDEGSPADAAHQEAKVDGTAKRYSPLLTPIEHPVWTPAEVAKRAETEAVWREGRILEAIITVQGWFSPSGKLWYIGQDVYVKSPMAMLDMTLSIDTVTFTQDRNAGTLTTLKLVPPWGLNGRSELTAGAPKPPGAAKSTPTSEPAQTPPAAPSQK
jgi:prophage tail gpP-like protein